MMKEELEKRLHDIAELLYEQGFEDGETKGLNNAWECARKILDAIVPYDYWDMGSGHHISYAIKRYSASEAMQKIKEYEQQKQAEKCEKCTKEISAECVVDEYKFEPKQEEKLCDRCKNSKLCELNYLKYVNTCSDFCPKTDVTDMNDGSIKVGDEVRIKGSDPIKNDCDYGICTRSLPNINTMYVMRRDGSSGEENKDEWYRTGRTFPQIAEVLKLLR